VKLEARTTQVTIVPEGERLFSEQATILTIEDEAAGEFLRIEQPRDKNTEKNEIRISPEEWPTIRETMDQLIKECREHGEA
jgi:hypothetical protein